MVKRLTTALGGLTVLTVAALATPLGQAMLGIHKTQTAGPVSVISDPGPAKGAFEVTVPAVVHPAAAPAARPVVGSAPPRAKISGILAIPNILLNLPQALRQGVRERKYSPAPQGQHNRDDRWRHNGGDQGDGGDSEHR